MSYLRYEWLNECHNGNKKLHGKRMKHENEKGRNDSRMKHGREERKNESHNGKMKLSDRRAVPEICGRSKFGDFGQRRR